MWSYIQITNQSLCSKNKSINQQQQKQQTIHCCCCCCCCCWTRQQINYTYNNTYKKSIVTTTCAWSFVWSTNQSINNKQLTAAVELSIKPYKHKKSVDTECAQSFFKEQINKSKTTNCLLLLNSTINQLQIQEDYYYNMCSVLCLCLNNKWQ